MLTNIIYLYNYIHLKVKQNNHERITTLYYSIFYVRVHSMYIINLSYKLLQCEICPEQTQESG